MNIDTVTDIEPIDSKFEEAEIPKLDKEPENSQAKPTKGN